MDSTKMIRKARPANAGMIKYSVNMRFTRP